MESNIFLPKADDFKNNKIKECPFCNALLPFSEYDDHLFCHTLDQQENGQTMNINNYGINQQQNNINGPSPLSSNNNINHFNNNNNQNNNSINYNNNNDDNNFSIFEENNNNQNRQYINPQLQNLNRINFINDNNNQNRINNNQNNINNNIQNNINNNQNRINNNNINNNINNNNQNNINNNNQNNNNNSENIFDKFKSNFSYFLSNLPNPFQNKEQNQDNNNNNNNNQAPPENLSEEERERRNRLEEQKAYEKKILGIMHENSQIRAEDSRSTGQRIKDYFGNNPDNLLAVVDVIGCLCLSGPSIGRTIMRVGRFVGNNIMSIGSGGGSDDINENENINSEEYQNMVRNHPELRKKNKDIETILKFLPISIVREIKENGNNNDNNNNNRKCVICLSDFEVGEEVTALPCLHVFHTECISSWIKKHCQCPVCKFDVTIQSLIGGH